MIQDLFHHLSLSLSCCDERHVVRVVHDGQRECDTVGWRLGRVRHLRHPPLRFLEQRMVGEERARVPVRAHAQKDEIKHGKLDRVLGGEDIAQLIRIILGGLLGI